MEIVLIRHGQPALGKLSQRKRSLSLEKEHLEKRINDIDKYILEYTSGLKEETELEHSLQKINSKMNMVTQLASGRKELEKIHKECQLALELVTIYKNYHRWLEQQGSTSLWLLKDLVLM